MNVLHLIKFRNWSTLTGMRKEPFQSDPRANAAIPAATAAAEPAHLQ